MNTLFATLFFLHDWTSAFLVKHLFVLKRIILIVAHLSLFGFLFPELRRTFGQAAEMALLIILFLSPLAKILRMRLLWQLMGLRRELGIFMAYLATVHGIGYLIDPEWVALFVAPYVAGKAFPVNPTYFFGWVAYLLTLPLLFTSNNLAQHFLRQHWKQLHRLAYPLVILVLLHHFSIRRGMNVSGWLQTFVFLCSYITLKLLAWKNFFPPLNLLVESVSTRYRLYRES